MTYKDYVKNAKRAAKRSGFSQAVCFDTVFQDFEILPFPSEVQSHHIILGIADIKWNCGVMDVIYTEQNLD